MNIVPEQQLRDVLLHVERPGRYVGGEFGHMKEGMGSAPISIALCFPDLYEIGMSNNAVRILFDLFNKIDGVVCDIVFAPAPDFTEVLKQKQLPLYTLNQGMPLSECDIIAFTVGYELAATNMLQVLELGQVSRHVTDRREDEPIVIAGGPAITNPVPFGAWVDGIYMGDAEAYSGIISVLEQMVDLKRHGATRAQLLSVIHGSDSIWSKESPESSSIIYTEFGRPESHYNESLVYYLSPNVAIVQEHGVVEIMRGCPNGCRFCHAGQLYKPYRQKSIERIVQEVEERIATQGHREITLSSLSTGDYPNLDLLIDELNARFSHRHVSFSLPSLKVNSFTLPVLKSVSTVRKSGLTFAIETPNPLWQRSVNKQVPLEDIITIISQAKGLGWKLAKFYFMTGLPFTDLKTEPEEIAGYLKAIYDATRIQMNINIGTFVPKPHTPYQWVAQLPPAAALAQLKKIKSAIQAAIPKVKVNFHDPYISYIEGIITRGDARVSALVEHAYDHGAKFDAWDEYFDKAAWDQAIESAPWDVEGTICVERPVDADLSWDSARTGAGKGFLKKEYALSAERRMTSICDDPCDHLCGVCTGGIVPRDAQKENSTYAAPEHQAIEPIHEFTHVVARYRKQGKAIYYSHINMMNIMEKMFLREDITIEFTHGFNPKPRLEFASPLPLGVSGDHELMLFRIPATRDKQILEDLIVSCNKGLPQGIEITDIGFKGAGHKSISAAFGGSVFTITVVDPLQFNAIEEMMEALVEEHDHMKIERVCSQECSMDITIYEGKGKSSNLLKCIDEKMPKYAFLSSCTLNRTRLLAPDHSSLYAHMTADRRA